MTDDLPDVAFPGFIFQHFSDLGLQLGPCILVVTYFCGVKVFLNTGKVFG
jgi:hypothetical protein